MSNTPEPSSFSPKVPHVPQVNAPIIPKQSAPKIPSLPNSTAPQIPHSTAPQVPSIPTPSIPTAPEIPSQAAPTLPPPIVKPAEIPTPVRTQKPPVRIPEPPSQSSLPPPPTPPSAPPTAAPELPNSPPPMRNASGSVSRKAPPPPPSQSKPRIHSDSQSSANLKVDEQQHVGASLRAIDVSAYTIDTSAIHKASNGQSQNSSRIEIDDSRFSFSNKDSLPKPRKFEGKEKLYPSGRGSSVPLNLAAFV